MSDFGSDDEGSNPSGGTITGSIRLCMQLAPQSHASADSEMVEPNLP